VVIGFSFDRGAFQARDFPSGALVDHRVPAAPPETFDAALARAGLPLLCLDLVHAPTEGPVAAWLTAEMPMRSIGGIFGLPEGNAYGVRYTQTIVPRRCFDAVVFVAETTAARRSRERWSDPASAVLAMPENLELAGDGVPTGWEVVGADQARWCVLQASEERSPDGARTVRLARGPSALRWADIRLVQKVSAQPWRGKRVQFTVAIRTETGGLAGALLFIKSIASAGASGADLLASEIAQAASAERPMQLPAWTLCCVTADVPQEADTLMLGLAVMGTGAAWFGDLVFAPV
jgi:hypothetical protein